jgi:hypothetical protein
MKFPARLRALPLGLISVVALVALSALFARDPLRDAATFANLVEVSLRRPTGYLLLAPVSNILDTLTLLSLRQHIALLVTILVCYVVWWWFFGRAQLATLAPNRRALREVSRIGVGLVVIIGVYVVGMIMPRPMASIEAVTDIIVIDFHAHTKFSHDGRPDWTPEDVRAWHRAAGFDVAYITDHRTFEGARDAWANNPTAAGTATVLLPGIEVVWRGEHVNVLDADRMFRGLLTETLRDIDENALGIASSLPQNEPVLIETFPGDLSKVIPAAGPGTGGVRAIEIIDGAPKGLGQTRRERAQIIQLADSANLALVAGSNNHGWGRTAAGWTLMFIPQWRGATPEQLSAGISKAIRGGGRRATRVVERYVADTETGLALPLTVPLVTWGMLRTMSNDERIVWLAWTAALYLLWRVRRARLNRAAEP